MRILLTGASGFIGGHLLKEIIKRYGKDSVVVLTSNKVEGVSFKTYNSVKSFLLDRSCFDDVTHLIHAGAFTPKDVMESNDSGKCFGNIQFVDELLSLDLAGLNKIVNLSTLDVYESTDAVVSERTNLRPISLYGSSKLYCESVMRSYAVKRKIDFLNLRIGHVYGPGEEKYKKILPVSIQKVLKNESLELWGDGSDLRSFIFIDDVVDSVINSLEYPSRDIDINVVSGRAISIKNILLKVLDVSETVVKINQRESNRQKRNLVFDNTLLLNTILGKETDFMVGLKSEYEYMKEKYENNI